MIGTPKNYFKWALNVTATRFGLKLFSVHLEVTKKCNARCNFCDYWKTKEEHPLIDYLPVIKHLDPISVILTGGEPLLRCDIVHIIRRLKKGIPLIRLSMITNGILLTEDLTASLYEAGLDQLSISLDFLDERHDRNREQKGLVQHICDIVPKIQRRGMNLSLNTVIMRDNLDVACDIVRWAKRHEVIVSFSCYSDIKTRNKAHLVPEEELGKAISTIDNLIRLKQKLGNIVSSDFYLRNIPSYFENGKIRDCRAGLGWVQVTPEGYIKRCSEHPIQCFWTEYNRHTFRTTGCDRCWFACRGESQSPFQVSRIRKYGNFLIEKLKNS